MYVNKNVFGWFDSPGDTPAHDPGPDQNCPICGKHLSTKPVVTPSFMVPYDDNCYFYRVHKECSRNNPDIIQEIEGTILGQRFAKMDSEGRNCELTTR